MICRFRGPLLLGMTALFLGSGAVFADETLPESNGSVEIPVQEWPRKPGPRFVKVYIHYPGGQLSNVSSGTGIMLDLHNWGGTHHSGTADPDHLANRFDVVVVCVDYLQSGDWKASNAPYDFGHFQALDALRALGFVLQQLRAAEIPFDSGRIFATGGSGGGNVSLMANKYAPRTFACIVDNCGMARLTDDIAFGLKDGSTLDAGYSNDPESPDYLTADAQAIRFVGHPVHAQTMADLGSTCKIVVVHGTTDTSCPVEDAQEMVANFRSAGLDVDSHFLVESDIDGEIFKTTGHSLGNRTRIVDHVADRYLLPDGDDSRRREGPNDFELRDEAVVYETPSGRYVISYTDGLPEYRFEPTAPSEER